MTEKLTDDMYTEKFWSKVDQRGTCWLWTGPRSGAGYGTFQARLNDQAFWRAHRYSWALANGEIQEGMLVLHRCDNRWCVNPEHLFIGTDKDNVHDAMRKGRHTRGTMNGNAKLTEQDVMDIRLSDESTAVLAKRYDLDYTQILRTRRGDKWKHLPMPDKSTAARQQERK